MLLPTESVTPSVLRSVVVATPPRVRVEEIHLVGDFIEVPSREGRSEFSWEHCSRPVACRVQGR